MLRAAIAIICRRQLAAAFACARCGAPTRRRRSESDSAPPKNITSAPIQMKRTSGLK